MLKLKYCKVKQEETSIYINIALSCNRKYHTFCIYKVFIKTLKKFTFKGKSSHYVTPIMGGGPKQCHSGTMPAGLLFR